MSTNTQTIASKMKELASQYQLQIESLERAIKKLADPRLSTEEEEDILGEIKVINNDLTKIKLKLQSIETKIK